MGKVTTSLNEKLETVKWGEYKVSDLFSVNTSKKRFDANKVTISPDKEGYPYIVRQSTNNGRRGYIQESPEYLNENNTIAFGQDTATMFYQNEPYFTGDKIKILKPKFKEFNQDNAQFFLTAMEKSFSSFSWGSSSFNVKIIENQTLKIPVKDGKPDFDFMGSFIAELEAERIAELEAYLEVTGLSDCKLTEDEQKALDNYGSLTFEDFSITDVFDIKNTKNILSRDITPNSGTVPYLCASADDNAISSYISYDKRLLDKGDCIFIGGKTFVVTYQEYDFFSNDSHNLALTLKNNDYRSKLSQIYLSTCVRKSLSHKYSWGDSISNRKIQKDNIRLPSARKKVDYSSMELLISAIQKIVIKDVVVYADKKIQAHKEVIHS
ncbi:restriction endonuclease subunit S [Vibrio anguillarum]|uniref:restriction endonuclease subunit S n=2 Tax=Vibrio anguillarum TaxID=55601 RepID=UPI00097E25C7|nr:restriction endonuclease subunit S [Vibrio anguillarum]AQM21092.1 hypothetical protein PN51_14875 [Vibrio anguillarum]AUB86111.1 restriction endonuclease [Vibrio anguillarum]AUB89548.1 restriction endonuclease [Vibrio anguillarum]AUB92990.1 restriction endonuclease [Vibrio anguillarum]AUB96422.1 restriction endonuclease [Vibrio anguillarum]